MGELFAYSIVSGLLLLAMYPVYKWLLAGEKQYSFNRAIIWAIYLAALLLPLLIPTFKELSANLTAAHAPVAGTINIDIPEITVVKNDIPSWTRIMLWIYLAGMLLSFVYTIIVAFKLHAMIAGGEKIKCGNYTLVLTGKPGTAPFSWLRFIVMNRED